MRNEILIKKQIDFFENAQSLLGMKVHINGYLSRNKDNFDRHFTTFTTLEFEVKHIGVRISGGRASFDGDIQSYEIWVDSIVQLENPQPNEYHFLEKYSDTVYRLSILKFISI